MAASSGDGAAKATVKKVRKKEAKLPFKTPHSLARAGHPEPPYDSEETRHRLEEHIVKPGRVPNTLRQAAEAAGFTTKSELPDVFQHAVHKQGRPHAEKLMRRTTEALVKKGVRFGGYDPTEEKAGADAQKAGLKIRLYTDQELRQAFGVFDLNGNDYIDAAELRHIFAQIGEMPTDNEISAMILLCDPRGEGTVNFDDFLNVFANPADALRNANIKGIKHLLPRKKIDFDIRDPLGLVLEDKVRLKDTSVFVMDVRKGSQSQEGGVKAGWKVISLEGDPVTSTKDFETRLTIIEKQAKPEEEEDEDGKDKKGKKGRGKGAAKDEKPGEKKQIKWDYSIIFEVLAGVGDSSSSDSFQEEEEEEEEVGEDEDEEEDL